MSEKTIKVYIDLLEEGTPTLRPAQAIDLGNGTAKLLPTENYNPESEIWQFVPGTIVKFKEVNNGGEKILFAYEKA